MLTTLERQGDPVVPVDVSDEADEPEVHTNKKESTASHLSKLNSYKFLS